MRIRMFEQQHKRGKLSVTERLGHLMDYGTFVMIYPEREFEMLEIPEDYDGVIAGYGMICGRKVYVYVQDNTYLGGTFGMVHAKQIASTIEVAIHDRCPVVGIYDSGGARIQEGADSLAACGEVFRANAKASGYIPQIAIIAGNCAGGAVYSPGLMDFIFTVDDISNFFVSGARVINQANGTNWTPEEIGGASMHAAVSGVSHFCMHSEQECYDTVRRLLDMIPTCYMEYRIHQMGRSCHKDLTDLDDILKHLQGKPLDMRYVIEEVVDDDTFLEIQRGYAQNVIIGLGYLSGMLVGIVASQPLVDGGVIDVDGADKIARFVQYLDAFNIPIVTFVDSAGFRLEAEEEQRGLIRHGAKAIYMYAQATTIKLTVVIEKALGGPYLIMGSKQLGADYTAVWPETQIAVMGAKGAVSVIYHDEIKQEKEKNEKADLSGYYREYEKSYLNAERALEKSYVDEEIRPSETRRWLVDKLIKLCNTSEKDSGICKKHGNMPL